MSVFTKYVNYVKIHSGYAAAHAKIMREKTDFRLYAIKILHEKTLSCERVSVSQCEM